MHIPCHPPGSAAQFVTEGGVSGPAGRGAPGAAPAPRLSRLRAPPGPPAFPVGSCIPPLRGGRRAVGLAGDGGRCGGGSQDASGEPQVPGEQLRAGLWRCRGDKRLLSLQRGQGTKVHLTWVREPAAPGLRGLRSALPERGRWDWSRCNLAGVNRDPGVPCPESPGASHGPAPPRAGLVPRLSCSTSLLSAPYALHFCPLVAKWQLL